MKKMKKLASLLLAVVMVMAMGLTAMADEGSTAPTGSHTLTVESDTGNHVYEAYQIFTGTEHDGTLSNIEWGDGVKSAELLADLKADEELGDYFANASTARDVADVLGKNPGIAEDFANFVGKTKESQGEDGSVYTPIYLNSDGKRTSSNSSQVNGKYVYTFSNLPDGYYLVKDQDDTLANKKEAYTDFILQVVADMQTKAKSGVPEVDKNIYGEDNNNFANPEDGKRDELAVGDTVKYRLDSGIPAQATDYDYYYFILTDELSKGLTFQPGTLKVYIGGDFDKKTPVKDIEESVPSCLVVEDEDYKVYMESNEEDGSTKIIIALLNAKAYAGKSVLVTYDAILNEDAVLGVDGNPNNVKLQFSNNPNFTYNGTNDEGKPGIPDEKKNVPFGETPKVEVYTYVTGIKIVKVDEEGNILPGAAFSLSGTNVNQMIVYDYDYKEDSTGAYYKLKDGTYTKTAPITEDSMKLKTGDRLSGYVKTEDSEREGYTLVGGVGYAPATEEEREGKVDLYVLVKNNVESYDSTTTRYAQTVTVTTHTETGDTVLGPVEVNRADGVARFDGLSSGEYTITETTTPDGYNSIEDLNVKIEWMPDEQNLSKGVWKFLTQNEKGEYVEDEEVSFDPSTGTFTITIKNERGNLLPETGGIGTTIFYTVGAILVLGAVVLLVTKKRMSREAK